MDIRARVREYLESQIADHALEDDDDFFALGFVDSLFAMQLVLFLEMEFGVTIEGDELHLDHFRTINAITEFVTRKTTAAVSA